MKKLLLPLLAAVLAVSACGILSSETREERVAREAKEARMVRQGVETGNFTINIDRMYPLRGTPISRSSARPGACLTAAATP